jgi:hypothetical protein
MLISAVTVTPARAQGGSFFTLSHTRCASRHDPAVEKALQVVAAGSSVEFRNASAKAITAYVMTYTVTRGKESYPSSATGQDFVAAPPGSTLMPGQTYRAGLWGGKVRGPHEVYPCLVVFDDRTSVGPPELLTSVMRMRQSRAEFQGTMIREMEAARAADDPKGALLLRAKRSPLVTTSRGPGNTRVTTNLPVLRYLEVIAAKLSGTRNSPLDQKVLADEISEHRALQQAILKQIALPKN